MPANIFERLNQRIQEQGAAMDVSDAERDVVATLMKHDDNGVSAEVLKVHLHGVWEALARLVQRGWVIADTSSGSPIYKLDRSVITADQGQNIWAILEARLAGR